MQYRHKAYKEFNLKIDLEIAAQINRHKLRTITGRTKSVSVRLGNKGRGNFILLSLRAYTGQFTSNITLRKISLDFQKLTLNIGIYGTLNTLLITEAGGK